MTIKEQDLKKEFTDMICEAKIIYDNSDTDKFFDYTKPVAQKFYDYNLQRMKEFSKKLKLDLPTIVLQSGKEAYAMAHYNPLKSIMTIVQFTYQKCIEVELKKNTPVERIVDIVNTRMLFAMMHEFGHHYFYKKQPYLQKPLSVVRNQLNKMVQKNAFEDLLKDLDCIDLLMKEAYSTVEEEKFADNMAFYFIRTNFPEEDKILAELNMKDRRINTYFNYARTRIVILLGYGLPFRSHEERKVLKEHCISLIEIN